MLPRKLINIILLLHKRPENAIETGQEERLTP